MACASSSRSFITSHRGLSVIHMRHTSPDRLQKAWRASGGRHASADFVCQNEKPNPIHEAIMKPKMKNTACNSTKPPLILLGTTSFMSSYLFVSSRTYFYVTTLVSYRNRAQKHKRARASYESEEDEFTDVGAAGHEGCRDDVEYQWLECISAVLNKLQATYNCDTPFSTPSITDPWQDQGTQSPARKVYTASCSKDRVGTWAFYQSKVFRERRLACDISQMEVVEVCELSIPKVVAMIAAV